MGVVSHNLVLMSLCQAVLNRDPATPASLPSPSTSLSLLYTDPRFSALCRGGNLKVTVVLFPVCLLMSRWVVQ